MLVGIILTPVLFPLPQLQWKSKVRSNPIVHVSTSCFMVHKCLIQCRCWHELHWIALKPLSVCVLCLQWFDRLWEHGQHGQQGSRVLSTNPEAKHRSSVHAHSTVRHAFITHTFTVVLQTFIMTLITSYISWKLTENILRNKVCFCTSRPTIPGYTGKAGYANSDVADAADSAVSGPVCATGWVCPETIMKPFRMHSK